MGRSEARDGAGRDAEAPQQRGQHAGEHKALAVPARRCVGSAKGDGERNEERTGVSREGEVNAESSPVSSYKSGVTE